MVYSTNKQWGTRLIPNGAITGLQMLTAPNYRQWIIYIDQTQLNFQASDYGGELDGWAQDGVRILAPLPLRIVHLMVYLSAGQPHRCYGLYKCLQY